MRVGGRIILSIISERQNLWDRHCSKALRWQERVKDSHGPDLQDILRYVPSIPFPSNITCPFLYGPMNGSNTETRFALQRIATPF